jgi:hypothetical protein
MICELFCPSIHGKTLDSDPSIETHYLVYDRFDGISGISLQELDNPDIDTDNEYDTDDDAIDENHVMRMPMAIQHLAYFYREIMPLDFVISHPIIRNYEHIVRRSNYIQPEIGEYILLPTQEAVAILKTFWLRIIQKKWKKIYKIRQNVITLRKSPASLFAREVTGKWPANCYMLPGLKGMLNELNK